MAALNRTLPAPGINVARVTGSFVIAESSSGAPTPTMPLITVKARITGITPDPTPTTTFHWRATLRFTSADCSHGRRGDTTHPDIVAATAGGTFTPTFTAIRGGQLAIQVQASVRSARGFTRLSPKHMSLIIGQNPTFATLTMAIPSRVLKNTT